MLDANIIDLYMNVLFEKDGWVICSYEGRPKKTIAYVTHAPEDHTDHRRYLPHHLVEPCNGCGDPVPDSVQAVFILFHKGLQ